MIHLTHSPTLCVVLVYLLIAFDADKRGSNSKVNALSPVHQRKTTKSKPSINFENCKTLSRRTFVVGAASIPSTSFVYNWLLQEEGKYAEADVALAATPPRSKPTCTDVDSCREIGEKKVEQDLKDNPITRLDSGVQYKQLNPGYGTSLVEEGSKIDLIYSISSASGSYMYSQGFGYEKINVGSSSSSSSGGGGNVQRDLGLDSYVVELGTAMLPIGVEQALVGMKKGERRRLVLPPSVGFETSNWKPEPTTRLGKAQIKNYQNLLQGNGSSRPAFPAPTIWDVEVLRILR